MKHKPNYIIGVFLVSLGIIVGVIGTTLIHIFTSPVQQNYNEINYLMDILKDYSYFYNDDEQLKEGALNGIMESLEDPYSVYFSEAEYNQFNSSINNDAVGVGINVAMNGSYPIIINVLPDSPADKAGLKKGDTIVKINDNDLSDYSFDEMYNIISGSIDDERIFTVYQNDPSETEAITLTLDMLDNPTVTYEYFEINQKKIGYLVISVFGGTTYEELEKAMTNLEEQEVEELIVDVRENPGGLLTSVTEVLDYFINSNAPFMYEQTRDGDSVPYYIESNSHEVNYDISVLMNENSASAAEVFAAAMNELGGYPLIGTTSFGKGTVQMITPINPSKTKNIKFTTDRWLTPSETWIHGVGIEPTIDVDLTSFIDLSYIDASKTISFDHVDVEIKDVQNFLSRIGYSTRTDGYFDETTLEAVKSYQEDQSIEVTGIVDINTAYQLNLDLIAFGEDLRNDNQYQKALDYVLNR